MELNGLDVSPELWSAGKIVAFSAQREPFFHIDGDVYLTGTLPPSYEGVDALCQFLEMRGSYPNFEGLYDSHRLTIESNLAWLPECWRFMSEGVSGNCGIIGGANLQAIHRYADDALRTLLNPLNQSGWNRIAIRSPMNCVIEQQMLWASMRAQDVVLTPLFTEEDFQCEDRLRAKALSSNFNHAAVEGKCVALGMQLEKLVEAQFPEQHRIISDLYPRSIESLAMPMQLISEFDNVVETPNISMVEIVRLQDRPRPKSNGQQTFNRKPRPQRDDGRA